MGHYCPFIIALGLVIALGVFTKAVIWLSIGYNAITLPYPVLKLVGISRDATAKIVPMGFVILSFRGIMKNVQSLGGYAETWRILLSLKECFQEDKRLRVDGLYFNALSTVLWLFILHYYATLQAVHRKVIDRQERNEENLMHNYISQFRKEFEQ